MPRIYGGPFTACAVDDCSGDAGLPGCAKGWCAKHYRRWRLYGDPLAYAPPNPGQIEEWVRAVALHFHGDECLTWPFSRNANGYGQWTLGGRPQPASREVCRLAHGEPPTTKHVAAHSCFNGHGGCVSPNHLRWATTSENEQDKILSGTSNRGARHGMAKLTNTDVLAIRAMAKQTAYAEVAEKFGVSKWTIGDIVRRKRWGWLS